jgi:hypothetical protein
MTITKQDILDSKVLDYSEKQYLLDMYYSEIVTPKISAVVFTDKNRKVFTPVECVYKNGRRYDKIERIEQQTAEVTEIFYNKKANEYLYTNEGVQETNFF